MKRFDPKGWIGYLVGYDSSNVYRIWNPALNKVVSTRVNQWGVLTAISPLHLNWRYPAFSADQSRSPSKAKSTSWLPRPAIEAPNSTFATPRYGPLYNTSAMAPRFSPTFAQASFVHFPYRAYSSSTVAQSWSSLTLLPPSPAGRSVREDQEGDGGRSVREDQL